MSYWVVTLKTSKTGVMLNMTLFKGKKALAFIASVIASFTFAMVMEADHSASAAGQTGYVSTNEGWRWLENGQKYTGFRYYMGTYYWFENGVRADNGWHFAWGFAYYTGQDGRALQGEQTIDGQTLNFGDDNTFYLRYFDGGSANPGDDPRRFMQPVTDLQFYYDENGHPIPGTAYWDN